MSRADVRAVSLVDAVSESVRLAVINAELVPGSPLTEAFVSEQYGVARSTAKAAVERLVAAGFLERSLHRTARVPALDREDIADLYETRIVIETDAVARLARVGIVPDFVDDASHEVLRFATAGNKDRVAAADVAFHSALVEAAGVRHLARMHVMLMGKAHLAMVQVQRNNPLGALASHDEHSAVLDRVREGDAPGAAEAMRHHLDRARTDFLDRYPATSALVPGA